MIQHFNKESLLDSMAPSLNYELFDCVGRGNFGDVFKARDTITKKIVAVKIVDLENNDENISLLSQEIFFLAQLKSKYITQYITTIVDEFCMWIVMEYCGGGSCSDLLKICYRRGMPEVKVSFIIQNVLLGLEYLHLQQKIHRDIKSANILLTDDGLIKLGDFGVSGQMEATLKRDTFVGTPYWMAPEIINRRTDGYDEKTDIWSLGITAYELIKGLPPLHKYDPMKVMLSIPKRKPPRLHGPYSNEIKSFIRWCLIKEPVERPSASDLLTHSFITENANKIHNLKSDVDKCKYIKSTNDRFKKTPRQKCKNGTERYNSMPQWNFTINSVNPLSPISPDENDKNKLNSNEPFSPVSSDILNNISSNINNGNQQHNDDMITPLTEPSTKILGKTKPKNDMVVFNVLNKQIDSNRCMNKAPIYELGSGMDLDPATETKHLTPHINVTTHQNSNDDNNNSNTNKDNHTKIDNANNVTSKINDNDGKVNVDSSQNHQVDQSRQPVNVDHYKEVFLHCFKRLEQRASDQATKLHVHILLETFSSVENKVPGFGEVFLEELMARMHELYDPVPQYV